MENLKTHICTPNGVIERLSKFDTIMIHPTKENSIVGYRDFGDDVETITLFEGSKEDVKDMMLNIRTALCI